MHSLLVPTLLWGYWANIVYIIGMIGYLTIDTISYVYISLNNTISLTIYIFLAIIFIIDAALYTIDWHMYAVKLRKNQTEPIQYRSEFVACIFQNLGSFFYFIGALLNFDRIGLIKKILFFNFIGIIAFLLESFFALFGWIIIYRRKSSNSKNTYIWAHILNIAANFIYLTSIILAYYFYKIHKIVNSNTILIIQIAGDFVYLLDAYLYHQCWQRDKEEFHFNTEQTKFYVRPH